MPQPALIPRKCCYIWTRLARGAQSADQTGKLPLSRGLGGRETAGALPAIGSASGRRVCLACLDRLFVRYLSLCRI